MSGSDRPGLIERFATVEPLPGVSYPRILDDRQPKVLRAVGMLLLGIVAFMVFAPIVTQLVSWVFWILRGQPGDYATFAAQAGLFTRPDGMLAVHLGLGVLIPISAALVLFVHRRHPGWLVSVRRGWRWRYLWGCLGVAAVVLNIVFVLSRWGQPWSLKPQDGFGWFLLVILLTSPIQAAAEEFFFRGYLMQLLDPLVESPWFGVVTSAGIFAFFHGSQNLPLYLDRFGFGLLAGILVVKTGGLEAGIAAHVINNICAFTYAGLLGTIAEVKAVQQVGWVEAAWDLGGFVVYTLAALWLAGRMKVETTTPGEPLPEPA